MTTNVAICDRPFAALGPTVRIAGNVAAPTAVQLPLFPVGGGNNVTQATQVRLRVSGALEVAIGWGATAAEALANAVFPLAAGASAKCITMGSSGVEVLTFPNGSFFTVLSTGLSNVDLTPGVGF